MKEKFFFYTFWLLLIHHVLARIEPIQNLINLQQSTIVQNGEYDFQYTLPIEVAKRHLQVVTIGTVTTLNTIENPSFPGVIINHKFPSSFVVGQIFQVKGKLTTRYNSTQTYVTFCFVNKANILLKYMFTFVVSAGNVDFAINADTRQIPAGEYYMGLYPGTKLCYNPHFFYPFKAPSTEIKKASVPSTPTECSLSMVEDKLVLKWKQDSSTAIQKLTFKQNDITVEYIVSNFQSSFQIINKDFIGFTNGTVTVSIASAYSSSNGLADRTSQYSSAWTYTFYAGPHNYSFISPNITLTKEIPWIVPVGTAIIIEGVANVTLNNHFKIEESSQFAICTYHLLTEDLEIISAGTRFSKTMPLLKSGTYILEIDNVNGQCLVNRPIYVGSSLPLIPDFSDLQPVTMDSSAIHTMIEKQPQTVDEMRHMLLDHVNEKRASWGRGLLSMDEALNDLAQAHSNDMVSNNYLSDVNKQGLGPQDRVNKAGLNYSVVEIVAAHLDLTIAHNIMCRLPSDLEIIIMENYTKIGFGVARNVSGYIYITQIFADPIESNGTAVSNTTTGSNTTTNSNSSQTNVSITIVTPITATQLQTLRIQVRDWIIKKYPKAKQDTTLSDIVNTWLRLSNPDTVFDYTWNTAKYPANYLAGSFVVAPYSTTFTLGFTEGMFLKQPDITYTKFGIGAVQQPNGKVKVYVEYAK